MQALKGRKPKPKGPDQTWRAWSALALALALLAGLELVWDRLPAPLRGLKPSHFLSSPLVPVPSPLAVAPPIPTLVPAAISPSAHLDAIRRLFTELRQHRRHDLRIAYFADSMTEGDLITEHLRSELQQELGGVGLGYQGMDPRDADARVSLLHQPGAGWQRLGLPDLKQEPGLPLGLDGCLYRVQGSAALRLESLGRRPAWYGQARLLYGPGALTLTVQGRAYPLKGTALVNQFRVPGKPQARLDLSVQAPPGMALYGVYLGSARGVHLDVFTYRGNSGEGLAHLQPAVLRAFQSILHYDLVVLQFGVNAIDPDDPSARRHRLLLGRSLAHLKANLRGARFMMVSLIDHPRRVGAELLPNPYVEAVVAAQREACQEQQVPYLDLYHAMGGAGVLKAWVEADPPLAYRDYTHLNRRGGARVADYVRAALEGLPQPGPELLSPTTHAF